MLWLETTTISAGICYLST